MNDDLSECECHICGQYKFCPIQDDDFQDKVCEECFPHVLNANIMIINDLAYSGLNL